MPSAERIRKLPHSLGVRTTANLFAFICPYLPVFALKTFFFMAAARHRQPAE
jgi:hypothetical protein